VANGFGRIERVLGVDKDEIVAAGLGNPAMSPERPSRTTMPSATSPDRMRSSAGLRSSMLMMVVRDYCSVRSVL
jgi:hypothetical protein